MKQITKVINAKQKYSIGIDSWRFVITKDSLNVILKKLGLFKKIKKSTRNIQIHDYVSQKFKSQRTSHPKYPFDIRYINLKRGNKSLSNTILMLENSKTSHEQSLRNKKSYNHYIEVVFAGFHQPSKDIDPLSLKILKVFLKRFKVYSIDLAIDFDCPKSPKELLKHTNAFIGYMAQGGRARNEGSSVYINETIPIKGLNRILLYDKFKKQTLYHKENIRTQMKDWKRLEITLKTKQRFFKWVENDGLNEGIELLNDMALKLGARNIIGLNIDVVSKQIQKLKDLRRGIYFNAWAKMPMERTICK